jgi:hypothetical protein
MWGDLQSRRKCDEQCSSTLKWITIEPADAALMAISGREEFVARGIACGRVNSRREGSVEAMG